MHVLLSVWKIHASVKQINNLDNSNHELRCIAPRGTCFTMVARPLNDMLPGVTAVMWDV